MPDSQVSRGSIGRFWPACCFFYSCYICASKLLSSLTRTTKIPTSSASRRGNRMGVGRGADHSLIAQSERASVPFFMVQVCY